MMRLHTGVVHDTISGAWLNTVRHLRSHEGEEFDLVVTTADPTPATCDPMVTAVLDDMLERKGWQRVATVANTIFPAELAATSRDREHLYARYRALLPRLRRQAKNRRGIYFERLIGYPLQPDPARANQVETIIQDLESQLARRALGQGPLGSVYEAQIFAPGKDRLPRGFPCLSSLSFQLDGDQLRLSATYRNQYFIQRALGNYLGLAQLQRFVATAVGLGQGPLTVHAFHAYLDLGKHETDALLRDCDPARASLPTGRRAA